jgi:hypothetical protein
MRQPLPEDFAHDFDAAFARLQVALEQACAKQFDWPGGVAAAIRAGLEFAAADPDAVRLLTSEALARGAAGIARQERLTAYLQEKLAPGRAQRPDGPRLPDITEHAMASGVMTLVSQRVDAGKAAELPAIAHEVIQFVLTPYVGIEEAKRIGADG